jgi:hypothetical protein
VNSADRGVLPRAIDVVFNSISGLESKASVSWGVWTRRRKLIDSYDVRDWLMLS